MTYPTSQTKRFTIMTTVFASVRFSVVGSFVVLALLLANTGASAQCRIGYSPEEIREEYDETYFESEYDEYGNLEYISGDVYSDVIVTFYFNEEKVCYRCLLIPKTNEAVNHLVSHYNETAVSDGKNEWIQYVEGGVLRYKLVQEEGHWVVIIGPNSD